MDIRETILGARAQQQQNIVKGFVDNDIEKAGEGSRGGNIIGHTKSGKAIYATQNARHEKTYTSKDHEDAAYAHLDKQTEHDKKAKEYNDSRKYNPNKGESDSDYHNAQYHTNRSEYHSGEYDRHISTSKHKKQNENLDKEIKKSEEDELEKAINRQVGDVHPNGKWVWTQLPSGKYDWRVISNKNKPSGAATPTPAKKQENNSEAFLENLVKRNKFDSRHLEELSDNDLKFIHDFANANLFNKNLTVGLKRQINDWWKGTQDEISSRKKRTQNNNHLSKKKIANKKLLGEHLVTINGEEIRIKVKWDDLGETYSYSGRSKNGVSVSGSNVSEDRMKAIISSSKQAPSQAKQIKLANEKAEMFKPNGFATPEFLNYLTKNVNKIWPGYDFSKYKNVVVKQTGSAEAKYFRASGVNQAGVNVIIVASHLSGNATGGSNGTFANPNIKKVFDDFNKK